MPHPFDGTWNEEKIGEHARAGRQIEAALMRVRRINARHATKLRRLTQDLAQARHLGYHDSLTGLPNRALLQADAAMYLEKASRGSAAHVMLRSSRQSVAAMRIPDPALPMERREDHQSSARPSLVSQDAARSECGGDGPLLG